VFQSRVYPAPSLVERLREVVAPRAVGFAFALLAELLLLLLLLSLGVVGPSRKQQVTWVNLSAHPVDDAPAPKPQPTQAGAAPKRVRPTLTPPPPQTSPVPTPQQPPAPNPVPFIELPSDQLAAARISPRTAPVAPAGGAVYGPPSTGGGNGDTPRVGTAPNGQPMYAAAWYQKPYDDQLRGYLSTASGPGWGLIACKTVPDWRVEDCVALDEYPEGSHIAQAVVAAAWQFRVRPPRRGGEYQVGDWVRIHIDYDLKREERRE